MIADRAVIHIDRALLAASISCPKSDCGMHCRCTGWVPAEVAMFVCLGCGERWYLELGAAPILRHEAAA